MPVFFQVGKPLILVGGPRRIHVACFIVTVVVAEGTEKVRRIYRECTRGEHEKMEPLSYNIESIVFSRTCLEKRFMKDAGMDIGS